MDFFEPIMQGLLNTFLIVLFSCILPLSLGGVFTLISSKSSAAAKIFHWLSLPFECITPTLLLTLLYFLPISLHHRLFGTHTGIFIIALTLSVSFIGYMPARYRADFSFLKNLLYNGCGLMCALIKWSTIAGFVAILDLFKTAQNIVAAGYIFTPYIFAFIFYFAIVLIFELAKRLINQFMR